MIFIWRPNRNLAHEPAVRMKDCRASVSHGRIGNYQCQHRATVERQHEGAVLGFCGRHDPERLKAKAAAAQRERDAEEAADAAIRTEGRKLARRLGVKADLDHARSGKLATRLVLTFEQCERLAERLEARG